MSTLKGQVVHKQRRLVVLYFVKDCAYTCKNTLENHCQLSQYVAANVGFTFPVLKLIYL